METTNRNELTADMLLGILTADKEVIVNAAYSYMASGRYDLIFTAAELTVESGMIAKIGEEWIATLVGRTAMLHIDAQRRAAAESDRIALNTSAGELTDRIGETASVKIAELKIAASDTVEIVRTSAIDAAQNTRIAIAAASETASETVTEIKRNLGGFLGNLADKLKK